MKYYDARHQIQTGDALICAGPWLFSRAIRFFTREKYSHVGMAVWITFNGGQKRLCMFEAMEGSGVQLVPLYHNLSVNYWPHNSKIWWAPLQGLNGQKVASYYLQHWADSYVLPYQFIVDALPFLQKIRRAFGRGVRVSEHRFHCSEIYTRSVINAGFNAKNCKDPVMVTPGDVSRFSCLGKLVELEQDEHIFPLNTESGW